MCGVTPHTSCHLHIFKKKSDWVSFAIALKSELALTLPVSIPVPGVASGIAEKLTFLLYQKSNLFLAVSSLVLTFLFLSLFILIELSVGKWLWLGIIIYLVIFFLLPVAGFITRIIAYYKCKQVIEKNRR